MAELIKVLFEREKWWTFSYTSEVVIVSLCYLLSCSSSLIRMMFQYNCFVCQEKDADYLKKSLFFWQARLCGKILTSSFDLFLCGFVPHICEAEDSIVVLILKTNSNLMKEISHSFYILELIHRRH